MLKLFSSLLGVESEPEKIEWFYECWTDYSCPTRTRTMLCNETGTCLTNVCNC